MRRDVDLQRKILFFLEDHLRPASILTELILIEGYDYPTILAHTELLIEDGLIDGKMLYGALGPIQAVVNKLTSRGHDAIAAVRNDTVWGNAKKYAAEHGAAFTMNILVQVATSLTKGLLHLPPG
jgi:hypothetical protein